MALEKKRDDVDNIWDETKVDLNKSNNNARDILLLNNSHFLMEPKKPGVLGQH